ncbi:signal peptidase I [Patescibacteria group bacterium]|nr:signal peptidase I [Patescibacteria group bacterium]
MRLTFGSTQNKSKKTTRKDPEKIPSFAKSPKGFFVELIKIVLIALAVIIPVRYFLFQPFYVRGASMEPSFHDDQYLIIDEITYRFTEPKRGEVVVIKPLSGRTDFLIKRIIGLPGETIDMRDGEVFIYDDQYPDGVALHESYLFEGTYTSGGKKVTLASNEYFVMGDNRTVSLDSRSFGPLNKKSIVGRAWLRVWPFKQFQHFQEYEYNLSSI